MLLVICFNWFIFYYLEIKLVPAHFAFCVLMLTNYERVKKNMINKLSHIEIIYLKNLILQLNFSFLITKFLYCSNIKKTLC